MLAAFQARGHVVRGDYFGLHRVLRVQAGAGQRYRSEVALLRLLLQCFEILPGRAEQFHCQVALDPAFQQRVAVGRVVAHHVEHGVGVGTGHRGPAIRGRCGLMHDQHTECALACAFFVLVRPTAIPGHALAVEIALAGLEVRVVDQHDGDLAFQVHALEVVPVALRGLHAIAEEHQRCLADIHVGGAVHGCTHGNLLALFQRDVLAALLQRQLRGADDVALAQRHGLGPQALAVLQVTTGLQAGIGELLAEEGDGLFFASGSRRAAFIGVGGQFLDVGGDPRAIEFRGGRHQCARHRQGQHAQYYSLHCSLQQGNRSGV
ncbi:hypothetical protein D3C72_1146370 [compost metagenome]